MNRLEALERHSMPPPPSAAGNDCPNWTNCPKSGSPSPYPPLPPQNQAPVSMNTPEDGAWSTIPHKRKRRKVKKGQLPGMPGAVHLVPGSFSYAMVNQKPANTNNPSPLPNKPEPPKASSTEVMVLCFGGLKDSQLKQAIRACPADAIACEVWAAVENVVHKPIHIIVGQWSVSSKSKWNFIYTSFVPDCFLCFSSFSFYFYFFGLYEPTRCYSNMITWAVLYSWSCLYLYLFVQA